MSKKSKSRSRSGQPGRFCSPCLVVHIIYDYNRRSGLPAITKKMEGGMNSSNFMFAMNFILY